MASFAHHQFAGIQCPPISSSPILKPSSRAPARPSFCPAAVTMGTYALTQEQKERQKLKEMFEEACERCFHAPMEGVPFTVEDFSDALEKYDFDSEIGSKVSSFSRLGFSRVLFNFGSSLFCVCFDFYGHFISSFLSSRGWTWNPRDSWKDKW